jgi:hypothetical protein
MGLTSAGYLLPAGFPLLGTSLAVGSVSMYFQAGV